MRPKRRLILALFVAVGIVTTAAPDILAVVGRPLTPVSVAGVARRTSRRTVRRNVYY
ncbi:MAG TPA: hypothetical protein VHH90_09735 [Polyangia bacterium]|nr:hypothetical protein [Polyangia bacterium]